VSPREWLVRLANLFRKRRLERQLADDLAAHMEEAERDYRDAGMTAGEARLAARREFGGIEQVKEQYRDQWGIPALEMLWSDCRHGIRTLLRDRGFTAIAVCSLALGIGASTAVFSLFQQVMLRSLSVQDPESLVYFYSVGPWQGRMSSDEPGGPSFSYPVFRELQKRQTSFVGIAGARNYDANLSYRDQASYERVRLVSGNYFELLGVRPALGRLIEVDDDQQDSAHPVVVLSYGYWESRLGASPSVLNQTILVNNSPTTVIGVAAKTFSSEQSASSPQAYIPLSLNGVVDVFSPEPMNRKHAWVTMLARLKPGTTLDQAEAAINVPYRAQVELDIQLLNRPSAKLLAGYEARAITLTPGEYGRGGIREMSSRPLTLMMATSLLVLLLACANVANLQLARGAARVPESVVRIAMGASRARLVRLYIIEAWVLAICGGCLGLGVAKLLTNLLVASVPWWSGASYLSSNLSMGALLFCLALSSITVLAFGLYPALKISAVSLSETLKDESGHVSLPGSASTVRKFLVTGQIAITTLLLITAGLFAVTLFNLTHASLGVKVDHLATFGMSPRMNRYSDEQIVNLHQRLTERLASISGVSLVSSAEVAAIAGHTIRENVEVEGSTPEDGDRSVHYNRISEGFFAAMSIPLVRGRDFRPSDNAARPRVGIVNEAFVRRFFSGREPLGASIKSGDSLQIVGIVKDAVYASVREQPPPTLYVPLRQAAKWDGLYFYLRTAVPPEDLLDDVKQAAAAVDATLPIRDVKTMQMQLGESTRAEQTISILTAALAALAALLAVVGLYGVLAYNVARRRREFGIRLALGAQPVQIRRLVAREGLTLILIGSLVGMGAAAGVGRLIESVLFGLEPWNGPIYLIALALVWAAAAGATLIPARRASKLSPLAALRRV
jgi:predicted permease